MRIIEDLFKYILYQRCQIPVPFDILERETRKQRQIHQEQEEADAAQPPEDMVGNHLYLISMLLTTYQH